MSAVPVRAVRLAHGHGLPLPSTASSGSAGVDLRAAVEAPMAVGPGERCMVPTGIRVEIPQGWEGQIRPRRGLALRHGLTVLNAPGTIDSDYRGEVKVVLVNHGREAVTIERGDRIAQLVIAAVAVVEWHEVEDTELSETGRGAGGFGSTGR